MSAALPAADLAALRSGGRLPLAAFDALMPFHLWIGSAGQVLRAGPGLRKIGGAGLVRGARVDALFSGLNLKALPAPQRLRLRAPPHTLLRGLAVPLAGGRAFCNLSLGMGFEQAVAAHGLTAADFPPGDATVEMLYLLEARTAVMAETRRLTDRLQQAKAEAERQAYTDPLTGLWNRRAMDRVLSELACEPRREEFGLMHIDLDYFKTVNDTLGHAAGDATLARVARILREETRKDDLVARVGGDEFILIFRNCADTALLERIAERIIRRLEEPMEYAGTPCRISASIGTTVSALYEALDADRMLGDADLATYRSKHAGRGRHTLFTPKLRGQPH